MNSELIQQRNYWNKTSVEFQSIYSKEKSKTSILLDKIFRKDMFERFIYTINNCEPIKSRTFLDIGSGTGLFSIELAKKGAGKVIGIDIAEKMVTISNKEAEVLGLQQVCNFIQSDLLDYNADADIDVSFGIGLFDYIKNPLPVLTKMQKISKDKAILSFPRFWTWRMPIRKIRLTLKGCSVYFYTKKRVSALLKDAGFKKFKIDKVGKLFCVVAYNN